MGTLSLTVSGNDIDEQLLFHASANFLCNFMPKQEYLLEIIKDMAIKPRYVKEIIRYLGIPGLETITIPMTCFCDIPLGRVKAHMNEYGEYGIALNKKYCIEKDVQPIIYLNKNARFMKDISTALVRMFEEEKQIGKNWEMIVDTLFTELLYLKPIEGEMQRRDNVKKALFKDECEWRYIPNTPKGFPVILPDEYNNEKGREKFTKALIKQKDTWFSFDVDNIEYIIVPNVQAANEIISKVSGMRKNRIIKNKLISKIEIMDKIQQNIV